MKNLILICLPLLFSISLFSQTPYAKDTTVNNDYLKKSKNQRQTGRVCIGIGGSLVGLGLGLAILDLGSEIGNLGNGSSNRNTTKTLQGAVIATGAAVLITGITYLVIAGNNKNKGLAIAIKSEQTQFLQTNMVVKIAVPAIGLRWKF